MLKILVVDDYAIVRQGLMRIIRNKFDPVAIDSAAEGQEALTRISEKEYDLVIMDVSMPGRNGIEILKDMKSTHPDLPVLMLSIHPEDQYGIRALKAGAAGYLTKLSSSQEIVEAIETVLQGKKYITATLMQRLAERAGGERKKNSYESLSDRELEVLVLLASGKSVSIIAEELSLSKQSISTYRARILQKLQLKNTAELTRYAIENSLVE